MHGSQTLHRGASLAYVFGPTPSISCSSSTEANRPCSVRQAMIFPAITGPTPGSSSSSCLRRGVQVHRLRGAAGRATRAGRRPGSSGRAAGSVSDLAGRLVSRSHHDLLSIGHRLGEVQLAGIRLAGQATGRIEGILNPAAGGEGHQSRFPDSAEHVHDHSRRSGTRGRRADRAAPVGRTGRCHRRRRRRDGHGHGPGPQHRPTSDTSPSATTAATMTRWGRLKVPSWSAAGPCRSTHPPAPSEESGPSAGELGACHRTRWTLRHRARWTLRHRTRRSLR